MGSTPATAEAALVVSNLTKRFGSRIAFDDVSFTVARGEVFGFLGPNGAGKTTMVRTLGTLLAPTGGSATVVGLPLDRDHSVEIRSRTGVMPETPGLYVRLTVRENLECFADLYQADVPRTAIDEALAAVDLTDRADDPCGTLSKGLRQRVALARALLSSPELLFLDEPTAGLDPVAARDVYALIEDLRARGATIFLTTHRLEEAERLCDRVAILNTTLRTIGPPNELRDRLFATAVLVRTAAPLADPDTVFASAPGFTRWQRDDDGAYLVIVTDATAATPAITRSLAAAGVDVLAIGESRHSLEDVYLQLVDEEPERPSR